MIAIKYLEILLDNNLILDSHVIDRLNKGKMEISNKLTPTFSSDSKLFNKNKLIMYQIIVMQYIPGNYQKYQYPKYSN